MSRSYDIDHTAEDAKSALRAIIARIKGVWDDPDLMAIGPLHSDPMYDVLRIAESVNTDLDERSKSNA